MIKIFALYLIELILAYSICLNGLLPTGLACSCVFGNERKNHHDFQLMFNGKNISRVDSCKYLGIIIDRNLSSKEHIDYVYKKLIKLTSIFYKIRTKMNDEILKMFYFAFVFPHLLYGIEIYGNTYQSHLSKLVKLNNKILLYKMHH